jgi:hypothetical protein
MIPEDEASNKDRPKGVDFAAFFAKHPLIPGGDEVLADLLREREESVAKTFLAPARSGHDRTCMRQILEIEEHVGLPPMMYADPFYRITYLIKEEIRKHKWTEGEKGRALSWKEARSEWTKAHRVEYERFLVDTLSFANLASAEGFTEEANVSAQEAVLQTGKRLLHLPHRAGG